MRHQRPRAPIVVALALTAALAPAACTTSPAPEEDVGEAKSAVFTNGGFETGAAGATPPAPWNIAPNLNRGITVQTPQTLAGLDLAAGGKNLTTILASAAGPLTQPDPDLGAAESLRWPRYGNQCAIVNFHSSTNFISGGTNNGENVNGLTQTMTIGAGDVDPTDHQVHVRFVVAPVLQNPAHAADQQPYYFVQLTDLTTGALLYSDFNLSGNPGVPWHKVNAGTATEIDYTDWQLVDISPTGNNLAMGDRVELDVIASGCSPGGHFGEIYVDGAGGAVLPGLFVFGTAAAQANACSDLTYTLSYENGAATAAAGVTVVFNTPPDTTFVSLDAPGLACTTPAAGAAGAVTCTIGTLAAGAAGSFNVTVNITCGTTGVITAGNYAIQGTGESPLLGSHINTTVGCTADAFCPAGEWCFESMNVCSPTLPNGAPVPTDGPHTNPTLDGTCTPAAGALVCSSGVCDATNMECGYANGDGPCTAANGDVVCQSGVCDTDGKCGYVNGDGSCTAASGDVVCRSGVCDPDGKCGYADGDGPCSMANGTVVCRSMMCSTDKTCEPAGGCNADADCPVSQWCDESQHTCAMQLPNGSPIPTDGPHTDPTLDGMCTAAAGALVCTSGVCDTDGKCGYADGDGPCTGGDGDSVCRSTICVTTGPLMGTCEACAMDSQCPSSAPHCTNNACVQCTSSAQCSGATPICDGPSATCVPCDGDQGSGTTDACGSPGEPFCFLAGPMTGECGKCATNADCAGHTGTVCDTATGLCVTGCLADADCPGADWCDGTPPATGTCVPKLPNGTVLPSTPSSVATCTATVGMRVCVSGACDTKDNACGYANGDGPCSNSEVCRSFNCVTASMTCEAPVSCTGDDQCPGADFCDKSGACTPKLPAGAACTGADQCQSAACDQGVCDGITPSGSGVACAASPPRGSGGGGGGVIVGLALAAVGLARRRRR